MMELTRTQRLKIALFGKVYLEDRTKPTWSGELPFYAFNCPKHGVVEDYPHGYYSMFKGGIPIEHNGVTQTLSCPHYAIEAAQYIRSLRKYPHTEPIEEVAKEVLDG